MFLFSLDTEPFLVNIIFLLSLNFSCFFRNYYPLAFYNCFDDAFFTKLTENLLIFLFLIYCGYFCSFLNYNVWLFKQMICYNFFMACFIAPTTAAIIATGIKKKIPQKYHFEWLITMFWGGVAMLNVEHISHGEVVPFPRF